MMSIYHRLGIPDRWDQSLLFQSQLHRRRASLIRSFVVCATSSANETFLDQDGTINPGLIECLIPVIPSKSSSQRLGRMRCTSSFLCGAGTGFICSYLLPRSSPRSLSERGYSTTLFKACRNSVRTRISFL